MSILSDYEKNLDRAKAKLAKIVKPNGNGDAKGERPRSATLDVMLAWLRAKSGLRYNDFAGCMELDGKPLQDVDAIHLREQALAVGLKCSRELMQDCILAVAAEHRHDPLRDYFAKIAWDGTERLATLLSDALGAVQDIYSQEVGRRFLVGAVERALNPGSMHRIMLILCGPEEIGKSAFCRDLCPSPDWYSDYLPKDLHDKSASEAVMGKFIIESAELASLRRSEQEAIKAFISRRIENFRPAYGHYNIQYRRRCVLIGTTNEDYPVATEGQWTRLWPVTVTGYERDYLLTMRDQIWAEAVALYHAGLRWWDLPPAVRAAVSSAREALRESDHWESVLASIAGSPARGGGMEATMEDALRALAIPTERVTRGVQTRIGVVMTKLGWCKSRTSAAGRRGWVWRKLVNPPSS